MEYMENKRFVRGCRTQDQGCCRVPEDCEFGGAGTVALVVILAWNSEPK